MDAAQRWRQDLEAWAVPPHILEQAPQSPWGFDVRTFDRLAEEALNRRTPTQRVALEALPAAGSVLDVGCGGGAASLGLVPRAGSVTGVDERADMLDAFAGRAQRLGVTHHRVQGRWPDVADAVAPADVVVCAHVLYNVADVGPFVDALTRKARHRVVAELTAAHPLAWLRPFWQRLHGLDRPTGPTADDAWEVLTERGLHAGMQRWAQPSPWRAINDDLVAFILRRLCLPASRADEVAGVAGEVGLPATRELVTVWWQPPAV